MSNVETQLYLATPYHFEPKPFADALAKALDAARTACVRLRLRGASDDELRFAVDALRPVCHAREVALVVSDAFHLVRDTGLDGVHFERGANRQVEARDALGADHIIGVSCGASRHQAMLAGERGADYVAFGPVGSLAPGSGGPPGPEDARTDLAEIELFAWWQETMQPPVVAEGGLSLAHARSLAGIADFVTVGAAVWSDPDGADAALGRFSAAIGRGAAA